MHLNGLSPWKRVQLWLWSRTRAQRDLLVIGSLVIPVYGILLITDAADKLHAWSDHHEAYEVDELIALLFCLGLAAIIFSARRLSDLRKEIGQRRAAENEAHQFARHDVLTGLPNRRRFCEQFYLWTDELSSGQVCALFIVDLDRFKPINDLYGHRLGDEVLRVVGGRLTELVGGTGMVARLGGDEFGILMPIQRNRDAAHRVARQIAREIPKPITLASLSLEVGVSTGVTIYDPEEQLDSVMATRDGSQVETILRQADMAMYLAKSEGRGLYHFFDRNMDEQLQLRIRLENDIKSALVRGEIVPYYQQLVDLKTQAIVGYEILARWQHPTLGLLPPLLFIPIAEDTGVISDLTFSLLTQALEEARGWPSDRYLSLNLSPRQFADPLLVPRTLCHSD